MRRALVIEGSTEIIRRLLDAGYHVTAMSVQQPMSCLALSVPMTHDNLRWHCFDVSDDRYLFSIENALGGAPVDVLVYMAAPEHFAALRAATGHLWAYACVGDAEIGAMVKGLVARAQLRETERV